MAKKDERQKLEKARQDIAKKYKNKIKQLEDENKLLKDINTKQTDLIEQLTSKLSDANDWIERMQEFCNMSDSDRTNYLAHERASKEAMEKFNGLMNIFDYLPKF